jgi:hypothetical protein
MSWSTREDLQRRPSADRQNPSMEYIAGPIEIRCGADGVFGQDTLLRLAQCHARLPAEG